MSGRGVQNKFQADRPYVVFRTDGSFELGSGHVIRCLTLANELRRRGAATRFISRALPGHSIERIESAGHKVDRLPANADRSPAADATATLRLLQREKPGWLIVDHYHLGAEWERAMRSAAEKILAIEDLADRVHDCDALVEQNWHGNDGESRYAGRVPQRCIKLLGPRYALLQPEYSQLRSARSRRDGVVRRIFIFFGASDATNETGKALDALSLPQFSDISVDVVIGGNHPDREGIIEKAKSRPGTFLHGSLPTLAGLMASADLAIGAGGSTTWERVCLGLPSLVTTLAENQRAATAALAKEGMVHMIGQAPGVSVQDYRSALSEYLGKTVEILPLVDGLGAKRVAEMIVPTSSDMLCLRRATLQDALVLYDWRNDPKTRAMSFTQGPVSWQTHTAWLERKLKNGDVELYIAEANGLPVGQIRLDFEGGEAVVSYSLDRVVRGRRWSEWMIKTALRISSRTRSIGLRAYVKPENVASRNIFARLGWTEYAAHDGAIAFRLAPEKVAAMFIAEGASQ